MLDHADPIKGKVWNAADRNKGIGITPLDLSIAKGARCLGVSSRLSICSISRFGSYRASSARSAADFRLRLSRNVKAHEIMPIAQRASTRACQLSV